MPPPPTPGTPISRYRDAKKASPNAVGMLFEGDSWFAYPRFISTNLVTELHNILGTKAVHLDISANGDEAREMLCGPAYERLYRCLAEERLQFDCILFSGGGNDIVSTNLPTLLHDYREGATWEDCLNMTRFNRRLLEIENAYRDLADLRDDYQPGAWIFTHSYDYATPTGKGVRILWIEAAGGWIKAIMDARKIPGVIQQQIVDQMLSRFDDMLIKLSQTLPNWRHVRTQGTLNDTDWANELHPTTAGFKKIAGKFQENLLQVFPKLRG